MKVLTRLVIPTAAGYVCVRLWEEQNELAVKLGIGFVIGAIILKLLENKK